jgi:hypothetical protein
MDGSMQDDEEDGDGGDGNNDLDGNSGGADYVGPLEPGGSTNRT